MTQKVARLLCSWATNDSALLVELRAGFALILSLGVNLISYIRCFKEILRSTGLQNQWLVAYFIGWYSTSR